MLLDRLIFPMLNTKIPVARIACLLVAVLLQWPASRLHGAAQPDSQQGPGSKRKPNFIIILMDDLGWADVGFNGSTFYQTPHLDGLAKKSIRFTQAYAASPVCSPSRAALLTGRHPARLQLTDWLPGRADQPSQMLLRAPLKEALPLAETTLAEALKQAGYKSCHIGKWHLGKEGFGPLEQGFDLNIGGDHTGTPASYFYPFANEKSPRWRIPGLQGGKEGDYLTDRLTQEASQFIRQHQDQPFLLYLAHYAVHIPLKAKPGLIQKYKALSRADARQHNPIYAAMIQSMDESVGQILQQLQDLELDENTVIIFTSDNGGLSVQEGPNTPATSNYPLKDGKGYLYEGGLRVPMLLYSPDRKNKALVSHQPVSLLDLYPTILEMAGVRENTSQKGDGKSLVPILKGRPFPERPLYWHYPHYSNQGGKPGWVIRQGAYKLIHFFEDGHQELYNLGKDPEEKNDLARQLPAKASAMRRQLDAWGKQTNAQSMKPNPDYNTQLAR